MKRLALIALAALIAVSCATAPAFAGITYSNGLIVVKNDTGHEVTVRTYVGNSGNWFEQERIGPGVSFFFNKCCYAAANMAHYRIDFSISVPAEGDGISVSPRLCSHGGILYGYAHIILALSERPGKTVGQPVIVKDVRRVDNGCP